MNRVRINDIFNICYVERPRVADIEVVPRKMVEMIIKECDSQISDFHHNPSIVNTATHIKDYANSLLKQFEEDVE